MHGSMNAMITAEHTTWQQGSRPSSEARGSMRLRTGRAACLKPYHPIHHRRAIACAELGLLYLLFFSALRVARSTAAPPSVTCAMCSEFPNSTPRRVCKGLLYCSPLPVCFLGGWLVSKG